jgi:Ser/Thr protein kinase RdoA (MazF antagonist)
VNNLVSYVSTGDTTLILRVYNNGENTARVRFEHAILAELNKVKSQLSFAIPETLPALKDGSSYVKLSNGAEASMFKLIPGKLPKLTCVKAIGVATGELTRAMYGVKLDMQSPTAPYYEIYKVHHKVTRDKFYEVVAGPDFDGVRGATDFLVSELRKVETAIEEYHALKLPMSWIHGDLRAFPALWTPL